MLDIGRRLPSRRAIPVAQRWSASCPINRPYPIGRTHRVVGARISDFTRDHTKVPKWVWPFSITLNPQMNLRDINIELNITILSFGPMWVLEGWGGGGVGVFGGRGLGFRALSIFCLSDLCPSLPPTPLRLNYISVAGQGPIGVGVWPGGPWVLPLAGGGGQLVLNYLASYSWSGPQLAKDCGCIGFLSPMHEKIPDSYSKREGGNPGNSGLSSQLLW